MSKSAKAFVRAAWWGALAGGGPFMVLTVPVAIGAMDEAAFVEPIYIALLPLLIAGSATLAGLVVIGLPLTWLLHRLRKESRKAYILLGGAAGFALPGVVLGFMEGAMGASVLLGIPGVLAGAVSGYVWGTWRAEETAGTGGTAAQIFE